MDYFHGILIVICLILFVYIYINKSDDIIYRIENKNIRNENLNLKAKIDVIESNAILAKDDLIQARKDVMSNFDKYFKLQGEISDLNKVVESKNDELKSLLFMIPSMVNEEYEKFKQNELSSMKSVISENAKQAALIDLEKWKVQYEMYFRQDAISRSKAVNFGMVTEHFIPFMKDFPFNPKKARFIGSPIDMIVFHGCDSGDEVDIHIIEIKTSGSRLSKRQKSIKDAVEKGRVYWREITSVNISMLDDILGDALLMACFALLSMY